VYDAKQPAEVQRVNPSRTNNRRSIPASLRMRRARAGAIKVRSWRIAAQLAIMDANMQPQNQVVAD
jgi:hypothetical protein